MWDKLLGLADRQGGVFSTEQAAGFGLGAEVLRRLLREGALRSVRQSIYCSTPLIEGDPVTRHRVQVAAALLARGNPMTKGRPTLVAGSYSAAVLLGLSVPRSLRVREAGVRATTIIGRSSGATAWVPGAVHLINGNRVGRTYRAGVHVCPATLVPRGCRDPAQRAADLAGAHSVRPLPPDGRVARRRDRRRLGATAWRSCDRAQGRSAAMLEMARRTDGRTSRELRRGTCQPV